MSWPINTSQMGGEGQAKGGEIKGPEGPSIKQLSEALLKNTHTSFGLNMFLRAGYDFLEGGSD